MEQWFEILGDRIGYLHLSDNGGLYDDHLPLGDGTVDWAAADALWKGLGRDTYLTFEVGPPEGVRRSIAYLKERGLFGMHAD
jgi:sugar phosphate isomerase/epimerase